jgi:hypothetical protein
MTVTRSFRTKIGILLVISALAACRPRQEDNIPVRPLSVPPGNYGWVLRFPDGQILIQAGRLRPHKPDALRYYDLLEERFVEIPFEDDPRCRLTEYAFPTALPDGRLGLSKTCHGRWPDKPIGRDGARYIVAYDWETSEIEEIVSEPLSYGSASFSWNPDMTRGVQDIGSLIGTIYWLTPEGMEPMTITVGSEEQSWALDENLRMIEDYGPGNDRSEEVGIARNPVWSPDGRFVAFFASTNVIGRSGMSRARGAYGLYLLDPNTFHVQMILDGIVSPGELVWSPNSQWLTFTGWVGSSDRAVWLVSGDGNTAQSVGKGSDLDLYPNFSGWNWLTDQELITTRCLDEECNESEVVVYDVSGFVGSFQE